MINRRLFLASVVAAAAAATAGVAHAEGKGLVGLAMPNKSSEAREIGIWNATSPLLLGLASAMVRPPCAPTRNSPSPWPLESQVELAKISIRNDPLRELR